MKLMNGSRICGTPLAVIAMITTGALSISQANAETIFTINDVDVDSSVVDLYFEGRLGPPGSAATPEQREALMAELRDIYILSTHESAKAVAADPRVAAQIELQRLGILAQAVAAEFFASIEVTEEELQAQYNQSVETRSPLDFKASHILLETQSAAIDVIAQLDGGAVFADLAKEKSIGPTGPNGGDLDWFSPNQMVQPFSSAVAAIEDGSYTPQPVQTQFGWHVIFREDSRPSIPPTFDASREEIEQNLKNEKFQAHLESLRATAE